MMKHINIDQSKEKSPQFNNSKLEEPPENYTQKFVYVPKKK